MTFGLSPANLNVTKYSGDQLADTPCVSAPRAPRTSDINYPLFTLWRNADKLAVSPDSEGDMWYLARFQANGALGPLAIWVKLSSGSSGNVEKFTPSSGTTPVIADGSGNVNMFSTTNGGLITIGGTNTINFQMQSPFSLSDFLFEAASGSRTITIDSLDGSSNTANATLSLLTQNTGGSPQVIFQSGSHQFVWGFDNINNVFSLSRSTVLGTNPVINVSPLSGGGTSFVENVGVNTTASLSPNFPLNMISSIVGGYLSYIQNTSTADQAYAGYQAFNSTNQMIIGMGGTGFVSNPVLQNAAFWQSTQNLVLSMTTAGKQMQVYINGDEMLSVASSSGTPVITVQSSGYLSLTGNPPGAGQGFINSFQVGSKAVPGGGSAALVTIGSGQIWMFICCTDNAGNNSAYRATAIIYGYANGVNFIQHLDTSNITFTNAGNAISLANAGANITLNVTGLRLF